MIDNYDRQTLKKNMVEDFREKRVNSLLIFFQENLDYYVSIHRPSLAYFVRTSTLASLSFAQVLRLPMTPLFYFYEKLTHLSSQTIQFENIDVVDDELLFFSFSFHDGNLADRISEIHEHLLSRKNND